MKQPQQTTMQQPDASVVWDGGWRQTSNQSYKIPLIKKDGGFTVVKIQVGVASNYKAQADATIDEKIGCC